MDCQQLIRDQELVNDYVKRIGESFIAESGSKAYPIYDGVMNLELYAEAKPRIAWVLKEPYDEIDDDGTPKGGDWPLSAIYNTENVYDKIKGNLTLNTMSYVTYGIMNNLEYADMPWIYENPAVAMRSDRAQNSRTEALNMIRNRKGHLPHIVVVTAEPLPGRIASIALGTGDIDCVYHIALGKLQEAVKQSGTEESIRQLETMIKGNRLKDISELPNDLY